MRSSLFGSIITALMLADLTPAVAHKDPESQENRSTDEDRFARQDVRRYSAWSSAVVIVGLVVVLGLLYLVFR